MDDLAQQIESLLWDPRIESLNPVIRKSIHVMRFFYAVIRDVLTTTLTLRAMGLVYITILSIVPILALAFSALKGFGIHRSRVEPALLNLLEPLGDKGVELTAQLVGFVDNVQGGLLAGAGLVLLIYTTVSMIKKIEDSLNHIWRVDNARNFVQRFGEYLSVVLVGPLIMVTAVGLIATVGSNVLVERMLTIDALGATAVLAGKLLPYFLVSLGFALAYWFIPNTRVKFRAALLGGLTGGVLWSTSGVLFATFVVNSTRNVDIYASFAVIIIALMWLYISWLILLIGAQTSFYVQNPEYLRVGYRQLNIGNEMLERIALGLMMIVSDRFRNGTIAPNVNQAARQLGVPGILAGPVKRRLLGAGLLIMADQGRLVPGRDPASITLAEILHAVRGSRIADSYQGGQWPAPVSAVFDEIEKATVEQLNGRCIYDLLDRETRSDN